MAYRAVLFDLDGTLVHTLPEYRYSVVPKTLSEFRVVATNNDIDRFWFGNLDRDVVIRESFGIEPSLFWKAFRKHDYPKLRQEKSKAYPDTDIIKELRQNGYKIGIVTGAPAHIAFPEIELLGEENFDGIILAHTENGIRPKPHPEGLEACLKLLGVRNNESIYVGNGDEDIESSKAAGILDVLVFRREHNFFKLTLSFRINSLYELRGILGM